MAEETLGYLKDFGGRDFAVVNRSRERAAPLAEKFNGQTCDWSDLEDELVKADIVVSTTGATEPVVTTEMFERVVRRRNQKPTFVARSGRAS